MAYQSSHRRHALLNHPLTQHADVTISSAAQNDLLQFDGTAWVNVTSLDWDLLSNVPLFVQAWEDATDPDEDSFPYWDDSASAWAFTSVAASNKVYAGFVDAGTPASSTLPAGWSVAAIATGQFRITHNLGLSVVTDLRITATADIDTGAFIYSCLVDNKTVNTFDVYVQNQAGASTSNADQDFNFIAVEAGTFTFGSFGGGVPSTRTITGGSGAAGGGDLTADRVITVDVDYDFPWTGAHTFNVQTGESPITIDGDSGGTTTPAISIFNQSLQGDRQVFRVYETDDLGRSGWLHADLSGTFGDNYFGFGFDYTSGGDAADALRIYADGRLYSTGATEGDTYLDWDPADIEFNLVTTAGNLDVLFQTANDLEVVLEAAGDAVLTIRADSDNVTETDNPTLRFQQDGNAVESWIGMAGPAGTGSYGSRTITNGFANALTFDVATNAAGGQMQFGTEGAIALHIDSAQVVSVQRGNSFVIYDSTNADSLTVSHDGTDIIFAAAGTGAYRFEDEPLYVVDGGLEVYGGSIVNQRTFPHFDLRATTAILDEKNWVLSANSAGTFVFGTATDAAPGALSGAALMTVNRTGTVVDSIDFAATSVSVTGALTATSYGGITEANLLDKTANETITGQYTFSRISQQIVIIDSNNSVDVLDRYEIDHNNNSLNFYFRDDSLAAYTLPFKISQPTTEVQVREGYSLVIRDSGNSDYGSLSHDGTDFSFAFTNTASVDFTGANSYTFDDLVDINAAVTISGTTTLSNDLVLDSGSHVQVTGSVPRYLLSENDQVVDEGNWVIQAQNGNLDIGTATDAAPTTIVDVLRFIRGTGTAVEDVRFAGVTALIDFRDGVAVRIRDPGDTDYAELSHDGTDFNFAFTNTTDVNFTGISGNYLFDRPIELPNATALSARETGGATRTLLFITGGDIVRLGGTALPLEIKTSDYIDLDGDTNVTGDFYHTGSKAKDADLSRSSTATLADDDDLAGWTLAAATTYKVTTFLKVSTTSVTPDFKYALQFSNAPVEAIAKISYYQSAAVLTAEGTNTDLTAAAVVPLHSSGYTTIMLTGFIRTHATLSATVDFQWAQNTSDATAVVLEDNSWITFEKVG